MLHLGPGLANALANLHNARKGKVPVVNIVWFLGLNGYLMGREYAPLAATRRMPFADLRVTSVTQLPRLVFRHSHSA